MSLSERPGILPAQQARDLARKGDGARRDDGLPCRREGRERVVHRGVCGNQVVLIASESRELGAHERGELRSRQGAVACSRQKLIFSEIVVVM